VRIFRVDLGEDVGSTAAIPSSISARTEKPTLAVLPFENMSGDPDQAYFSTGITEDIITELSRFHQLRILSRSITFRYQDRAADVKRLGRELGAQYILEGSIRRLAERIRITTKLVDTESGDQIWAEHFDRSQEEIFAVQDEIVRIIVGTLVGRVWATTAERARRKPPASLGAYECVLRGAALPFGDERIDAEKRRLYEQAIALDPGYGLAHALLALSVFLDWWADMTGSDTSLDRAFELARRAVALDENDSTCHHVLGWIYLHRKSFELAEQYFHHTLELNPNDPELIVEGGFLYAYLGKPDQAIDWIKRAKRLDPYFNQIRYWHYLGYAHFIAHQYEAAVVAFSHSATMPFWVHAYLAASYAHMEKTDLAQEFAAQVLRLKPDFSTTRLAGKEPFKRPEDRDHLLDGLRKAGLPD
jgi:adenylate cyclase